MYAILITGGAGFIGSSLIQYLLTNYSYNIINIDNLSYAANLAEMEDFSNHARYTFINGDIKNSILIQNILQRYQPIAVLHLAAHTHVDRSIHDASDFIETNIIGTYRLLECCRQFYQLQMDFRFIHVSTDEVFGSADPNTKFNEHSPQQPSSPYSASKASSDLLVLSWWKTYKLPIIISNCTNNYGPYQFPEKLLPMTIKRALSNAIIPIYGDGENIRDWIHVIDHVRALCILLEYGKIGERYLIGANNECSNLVLVQHICSILDKIKPRIDGKSYLNQIKFVTDRLGHDFRYAVDASKIATLGWQPHYQLTSSLPDIVAWYVAKYTDIAVLSA